MNLKYMIKEKHQYKIFYTRINYVYLFKNFTDTHFKNISNFIVG